MSGKVDEFGYPDYTADFDGRLISAAGGASGKLTLLNGQQITFPWKRQQEIVGSYPGYIQVYDDPGGGGGGVEYLVLSAPKLLAGTTSAGILLAGYNDGTSSVVIQDGTGESLILSGSGVVTTSSFYAGTVTSTGLIDGAGGITVVGGSVDLRSSNSVDVNIQAGTGRDAYVLAGRDVWVLPDQDLLLQPVRDVTLFAGRNNVVASTSGYVQISGGTQVSVTAQAGDVLVDSSNTKVISMNAANLRAVRANGYPLVALRNVQNAAVGTAPVTTAAAPGYYFQAGRQAVTFVAGAGNLTFPTAFTTGLLFIVCITETNDTVLAFNPGSSTAALAALSCFTAGVAVGGVVAVDYIAIGW